MSKLVKPPKFDNCPPCFTGLATYDPGQTFALEEGLRKVMIADKIKREKRLTGEQKESRALAQVTAARRACAERQRENSMVKIMRYLRETGPSRIVDIAAGGKMNVTTVRRNLKVMSERGMVKMTLAKREAGGQKLHVWEALK